MSHTCTQPPTMILSCHDFRKSIVTLHLCINIPFSKTDGKMGVTAGLKQDYEVV